MAVDTGASDAPFGEFEDEPGNENGSPYSRFRGEQQQREKNAVNDARWGAHIIEAPTEWYAEPPPKRDWLLRDSRHPRARGVLPLGKVGQMIAEGGIGKTMVACQLAVAVATSTHFLGVLSVASPGRVLLVLGEEDAEEARRRLHRAEKVSRAVRAPEPGSIVVMPFAGVAAPMLELDGAGNLVETSFLQWLRTYVRSGGFRLVAIDPLSRFAGPTAEIDNAAGTRFIQALESIVSPTTTVLNVHHTNKVARTKDGKLDATSGRGSSSLVDGARWQCALSVEYLKHEGAEEQERFGEIVTFAVTKSNYAAKPEPILLRRDGDNGGALVPLTDDDAEAVRDARLHDGDRTAKLAARETAKADGNRQRDAEDDEAARAIIARFPGATVRALVAHVRSAAGCGQERAHAAVVRVRGSK